MDHRGAFSHFALRLAKEHGRKVDITILDGRDLSKRALLVVTCAGVLSETLINKMEREGIVLPKIRVQQEIDGYYFLTQERGIPLHHPKPGHKPKIITVFRGNGPRSSVLTTNISFDDYLLKHVASQGAKVRSAVVEEIAPPKDPQDLVNIAYKGAGIREKMSTDLVGGAFGMNTSLIKRIVGKEFGYREPGSVRTCNAELHLGRSYIQERFNKTIYVFALGIKPIKFRRLYTKRGLCHCFTRWERRYNKGAPDRIHEASKGP